MPTFRKNKKHRFQPGCVPTFTIQGKSIVCNMAGTQKILYPGQSINYTKHGSFYIDKVLGNGAAIFHTTPAGRMKRIWIWPKRKARISKGRFKVTKFS